MERFRGFMFGVAYALNFWALVEIWFGTPTEIPINNFVSVFLFIVSVVLLHVAFVINTYVIIGAVHKYMEENF